MNKYTFVCNEYSQSFGRNSTVTTILRVETDDLRFAVEQTEYHYDMDSVSGLTVVYIINGHPDIKDKDFPITTIKKDS